MVVSNIREADACAALAIVRSLHEKHCESAKEVRRHINYAAERGQDLREPLRTSVRTVRSWIPVLTSRIAALRAAASELQHIRDRITAAVPRCRCGAELPQYADGVATYCPRCGNKQGEL